MLEVEKQKPWRDPKTWAQDHHQLGGCWFRMREGSQMGDTPVPLQSPNPTECLAKAQDLPWHVGKQSSAFAAVAKQVLPLQRALSTRLVLGLLHGAS